MEAQTIHASPLQNALNQHAKSMGGKWQPDETTYNIVGVKKKRFWQLMRGDKRPTIDEARAFSDFFKVPLNDLF